MVRGSHNTNPSCQIGCKTLTLTFNNQHSEYSLEYSADVLGLRNFATFTAHFSGSSDLCLITVTNNLTEPEL